MDKDRLERIFGDVMPEITSDERAVEPEDAQLDNDDWLRDQVPPHSV